MTRRGSPEERRWRRWRNMETGSDGSVHGEQPVDPRGRDPREKPSGHRHRDPQPPDEHGSGKHDSTVADNPHGQGTHDSTVAANPHGNAAHSPGMVEDPTSSAPSLRRGDRASQPTPSNVAVGSRYVVEDEANTEEVAADTTSDGTADTWQAVADKPHRDRSDNPHGTTHSQVGAPTDNPHAVAHPQLGTVSPDQHHTEDHATRHSEGGADAVSPASIGAAPDPHTSTEHDSSVATNPHDDSEHSKNTVANVSATPEQRADTRNNQPGADTVPVGTRYWVTDENVLERSNGTTWDALAGSPDATVAFNVAWPSNDPSTVVLGPTSGILGEGWRVGGVLIGRRDELVAGDQASYVALVSGAYAQRDLDPDLARVHVIEEVVSSETVDTRLVTFDDTDGVNKVGLEFSGTGDFPADMVFRGEFSGNAEVGRVVTNADRTNVAAFSPNTIGSDRIRVIGGPMSVEDATASDHAVNQGVADSRYVNDTGDTMTGTLTMEPGNDVGWVLHDANATEVARADTPGADHARFTARERDGTLAGSRVEVRNSSHASGAQTDVVGDPVKVAGPLETDHGFVPTEFVTANESDTQNKRNSDHGADGTDDHVTIQAAIDALPVGTK